MAVYIPPKDGDLLIWSENFSSLLSANPTLYGLSAPDAVSVAAAVAAFAASYAIATTEATRTKVTVATKDTDRNAMLVLLRAYSSIIQANLGVSQADKTALGLTIRKTTKTPVTTPTSAPTMAVLSQVTGDLAMTYHDPNAGAKIKAKPFGVVLVEIFAATNAIVVTDPETLPVLAHATKTPFHLAMDPADKGKTLYFAARWLTRTGLAGPFSAIGSVVVS